MTKIERCVYDLLKRNPKLKCFVRNVYQRSLDFVPTARIKSAYPVTCREGYFFGFHDHCPFNRDNTLLSAGAYDTSKPLSMPGSSDALDVGVFSGKNFSTWRGVASTRAWNWHQGCKLQWKGPENVLVVNDHVGGTNAARMINVASGQSETLPDCVGSISPDGKWAAGYSFERVNRYMPGYGYVHASGTPELDLQRPEKDGIYVIDLESRSKRLLFSIRELADKVEKIEPTAKDSSHYVTHAVFSPSSKRFAFLHRWIKGDVLKRWSKIFTCDVGGKDLRIYPNYEMASHLGWRDEDHLFVYCRQPDGKDGYVLFDDRDPGQFKEIAAASFNSDGHPSWDPSRRFFVTDTYPDRFRLQGLIVFDAETDKRYDLARVKTYRKFASVDAYRHWACDLHPRWDRTGRYLCFDATYTGKRSLCTLDFGVPIRELIRSGAIKSV